MDYLPDSACPTVPLRDSGRFLEKRGGVSLRRFPFPFRSALAISNDSRGASLAAMHDWHRVPASLGLEVGDSIHIDDDGRMAGGPEFVELACSGLCDAVSGIGPLTVDQAADVFGAAEFKPLCWTDDRHDLHYAHAPLGARYISNAACIVDGHFGEHIDFRQQALLDSALQLQWDLEVEDCLIERAQGDTIGTASVLSPSVREKFLASFNKLQFALNGQPQSGFALFKRFRGWDPPSASSFCVQVRSLALDSLNKGSGAVIVAQRFGLWRNIGRSGQLAHEVQASPPVFSMHEEYAWSDLASRFDNGDLWVTMPSKLLSWLQVRQHLQYSIEVSTDVMRVTITGWQDAHGKTVELPSWFSAHGLAFTVPEATPVVTVEVAGRLIQSFRRDVDPLLPGYHCIHLPTSKNIWPVKS